MSSRGASVTGPSSSLMPACDHLPSEGARLLDVSLRACGAATIDHLLRGSAAHRPDDARLQILLGVTVLVIVGSPISHAEGLAARNDGHPVDRIRARDQEPAQRVAALVVRHPLALF